MKAGIHPKWYPEAQVTCACGNVFVMGMTIPSLHVDVCSNCHPFYTGTMKFLDTAGRVDAFRAKVSGAKKIVVNKTEKRKLKKARKIEEERTRPTSLEDIRKSTKH